MRVGKAEKCLYSCLYVCLSVCTCVRAYVCVYVYSSGVKANNMLEKEQLKELKVESNKSQENSKVERLKVKRFQRKVRNVKKSNSGGMVSFSISISRKIET